MAAAESAPDGGDWFRAEESKQKETANEVDDYTALYGTEAPYGACSVGGRGGFFFSPHTKTTLCAGKPQSLKPQMPKPNKGVELHLQVLRRRTRTWS